MRLRVAHLYYAHYHPSYRACQLLEKKRKGLGRWLSWASSPASLEATSVAAWADTAGPVGEPSAAKRKSITLTTCGPAIQVSGGRGQDTEISRVTSENVGLAQGSGSQHASRSAANSPPGTRCFDLACPAAAPGHLAGLISGRQWPSTTARR